MITTLIKVWIVKKPSAKDIFYSLKGRCHPANRYQALLRKQKVPFTKEVVLHNGEDYYLFKLGE